MIHTKWNYIKNINIYKMIPITSNHWKFFLFVTSLCLSGRSGIIIDYTGQIKWCYRTVIAAINTSTQCCAVTTLSVHRVSWCVHTQAVHIFPFISPLLDTSHSSAPVRDRRPNLCYGYYSTYTVQHSTAGTPLRTTPQIDRKKKKKSKIIVIIFRHD